MDETNTLCLLAMTRKPRGVDTPHTEHIFYNRAPFSIHARTRLRVAVAIVFSVALSLSHALVALAADRDSRGGIEIIFHNPAAILWLVTTTVSNNTDNGRRAAPGRRPVHLSWLAPGVVVDDSMIALE